jgi:hypothetical protein
VTWIAAAALIVATSTGCRPPHLAQSVHGSTTRSPEARAIVRSVSTASLPRSRAAEATDRVSRTVDLSPGTAIRVDATVADLSIVGSNRSDVQIDIVRRAPRAADLAKYPVSIERTAGGVRIASVQANDGRDPNLETDIAILAPAGAPFDAVRVFEGRIRVTNLRSACDVDLRRGAIDASGLAGRIRLESGIGSLDVKDSELTPGGMMRLRVFNGPLRVRFARVPVNARILAVTFNGTITSDISLTTKDQFGPRFAEATLGSGDPVLSMDVVQGDIAISVAQR